MITSFNFYNEILHERLSMYLPGPSPNPRLQTQLYLYLPCSCLPLHSFSFYFIILHTLLLYLFPFPFRCVLLMQEIPQPLLYTSLSLFAPGTSLDPAACKVLKDPLHVTGSVVLPYCNPLLLPSPPPLTRRPASQPRPVPPKKRYSPRENNRSWCHRVTTRDPLTQHQLHPKTHSKRYISPSIFW